MWEDEFELTVKDLRSCMVRLKKLAETAETEVQKEAMKLLLEEIYADVFEALKKLYMVVDAGLVFVDR